MKIEAGEWDDVTFHCGFKLKDGTEPYGDNFYFLDDGKPVRFFPKQDQGGSSDGKIHLHAVYSFMKNYESAPVEEGREFEYLSDVPRKKVQPK